MIKFTAVEGWAVRTFTQGVTDRVTEKVTDRVTEGPRILKICNACKEPGEEAEVTRREPET